MLYAVITNPELEGRGQGLGLGEHPGAAERSTLERDLDHRRSIKRLDGPGSMDRQRLDRPAAHAQVAVV